MHEFVCCMTEMWNLGHSIPIWSGMSELAELIHELKELLVLSDDIFTDFSA